MTDNPYAPPRADLGADAPAVRAGGRGDFSIGTCLSDAWAACWRNFPLWLGVGIVGSVLMALGFVTLIGIFLAVPVLGWGFALFALHMHDGRARFGDLFDGFRRYGETLGPMLVLGVLTTLIGMLGQSVQFLGTVTEEPLVAGVGGLVNVAWAILVTPRVNLAFLYAVDRRLPALEALSTAWERTSPVKWKIGGLMLLSFPIAFLGFLALLVGIIPAMVINGLLWVSAYRQMEGGPEPSEAA